MKILMIFGVATMFLKNKNGDVIKIGEGYMNKEEQAVISSTTETFDASLHGAQGIAESYVIDQPIDVQVPMRIDANLMVNMFPDVWQDNGGGNYSVKSIAGNKLEPVEIWFKPRGAADDSRNINIPAVLPIYDMNIVLTPNATSGINMMFKVSGFDEEANQAREVIINTGVPLPAGSITGIVEDTAVPVVGAKVTLTIAGTKYVTATTTGGVFTYADVPIGTGYSIDVSHATKAGNVASLDVVQGVETDAGTIALT